MHQTAVYREDRSKALEELTSLLCDALDLCGAMVFRDNEELHRRRAGLLAAVFQALKQILLFVKNSLVTGIKLVIDPTGFTEKLKERMDMVKLKAQQFESQALKLSMVMQAHSAKAEQVTSQEVQGIAARMRHMETLIMQSKIATFDA